MKPTTRSLAALAALALAGCGETANQTTAAGTVAGQTFKSPNAVFNLEKGSTRDHVIVLISDDPKACDFLDSQSLLAGLTDAGIPGSNVVDTSLTRSRVQKPSAVDATQFEILPSLFMRLEEDNPFLPNGRDLDDDLQANFDPGRTCTRTTPVVPDGGAPADGGSSSGRVECGNVPDLVLPTGGTARMEGSSAAEAVGSFDLAFAGGGKLTGTFKATKCANLKGGCSTAEGLGLLPIAFAAASLSRRRRRS